MTDLVYVPVLGVRYDRSAPGRISARFPRAWSDHVKLRHRIDWDRLQRLTRDSDLISVVVPCFERPEVVLEQLRMAQKALAGRRWEAVVVDVTPGRQAATLLAPVVATAPVRYHRLPMRASSAFAIDEGFARTTGATLLVLGSGEVPLDGALAQLIGAAKGRTSPYLTQPVVLSQSGAVVTAGAAIGADQPLPGGLLAGQPRPGGLTQEALELSAPDGHTYIMRADDFAALRGLDVLFDNELEVADLGLRLRALAPDAAIEVLPAALVRRVAPLPRSAESAASRRLFTERHGPLPPTPAETWSRLGLRIEGWQATTWPHAVRTVVESEDSDADPVAC